MTTKPRQPRGARAKSAKPPQRNRTTKPSPRATSQRQFLQQTLKVIDAEMAIPSKPSEVPLVNAKKVQCRKDLSELWKYHAEAEVTSLKNEITKKQAQIEAENRVLNQAQRMAAVAPAPPSGPPGDLAPRPQPVQSARGGDESTKSSICPRCPTQQQRVRELAKQITAGQTELEGLRRQLSKSLMVQKCAENELFGNDLQIMRLHEAARDATARANEVSKEVKRVNKSIPRYIEERVKKQEREKGPELIAQELQRVEEQFRREHFKFMEPEELQEELDRETRSLRKYEEYIGSIVSILSVGSDMSSKLSKRIEQVSQSADELEQTWSYSYQQSLAAQKDSGANNDELMEDFKPVMSQIKLELVGICEALDRYQSIASDFGQRAAAPVDYRESRHDLAASESPGRELASQQSTRASTRLSRAGGAN